MANSDKSLSALLREAGRELEREGRLPPQEDPASSHYRLAEDHSARDALRDAILKAHDAQPDGFQIERFFVPATGGTHINVHRGKPTEHSLVAGVHDPAPGLGAAKLTFLRTESAIRAEMSALRKEVHEAFVATPPGGLCGEERSTKWSAQWEGLVTELESVTGVERGLLVLP